MFLQSKIANQKSKILRRGSAYLLVLTVSLIVSVIGLSGIALARIHTRAAARANEWSEAGVLAFSATEQAVATLNANPSWRTAYQNNVETAGVTLGHGIFNWKLVDETDGNLSNITTQPVRCYGIGRVGQTVRVYSVSLEPSGTALAVLKTAAHCNGKFNVKGGTTITTSGGPVSTNDKLEHAGTVNGNVEAASESGGGTVNGTVTIPAPAKPAPSASVWNMYLGKATDIPWANFGGGTGAFQPGLLSAAANPYGPTNPNGVYHIVVGSGQTLTISQSRIKATLLVEGAANAKLKVSTGVLWEAPRPDYPILIARGSNIDVTLDGSSSPLSEVLLLKNLNPQSTPYNGQWDIDLLDIYTTQLQGLIHVTGSNPTLTIGNSLKVKGTVMIDGTSGNLGTITVGSGTATITVDPNLFKYPPKGYSTLDKMAAVSGSWRWEAAP